MLSHEFVLKDSIRGMSCPSWEWHRIGSRWSPVRTLPVAPLWCDLGFVPNSRGNKAAANLRPSLIHQLKCMNISQTQDVILTSADIAALYPSINLEHRLTAMQWFMTRYASIPLGLQRLYIRLAQFVLEINYVECDGLPDAFLQKIGTAWVHPFQ